MLTFHYQIPGVDAVHQLHVWCLNEHKSVASAHVAVSHESVHAFTKTAKLINECLCAYGVHSVALQPELPSARASRHLETSASPAESLHISAVGTRGADQGLNFGEVTAARESLRTCMKDCQPPESPNRYGSPMSGILRH